MSADSIDVIDSITVEVEIQEVKTYIYYETSEDVNDHSDVIAIKYENVEISEHIAPMFTDDELMTSDELETELSLNNIKAIAE